MRRALAAATVAICLLACGGAVDRGGDPGDEEPTTDESTSEPGSPDEGASGGENGSLALASCEPGFPLEERSAFKACTFFFDDLCYETKAAACACACPDRAGTTCLSGFPQYDGQVEVFCD